MKINRDTFRFFGPEGIELHHYANAIVWNVDSSAFVNAGYHPCFHPEVNHHGIFWSIPNDNQS